MKKLAAMIVVVLLAAGGAYAKGYEVSKKVDGYDMTIRLDKTQPVVGENTMIVEIKDSTGKFVTDAVVRVDYSMPAMPGMPPMNYKTNTELKGNAYTAMLNLSMSGSWNVAVNVTRSGKATTVKMTVDAK